MPVHHHRLLLVKPATDCKIYAQCPDTLPVSPVDEGDHPAVPGQRPRPHLPRVGEVVAGVGRGQAWRHYKIITLYLHTATAHAPTSDGAVGAAVLHALALHAQRVLVHRDQALVGEDPAAGVEVETVRVTSSARKSINR